MGMDGGRELFFGVVGGGIFARDREDPAPTVGQCGDGDDWHCGERARSLVRQAIRRDIFWPYAANGVPSRGNRGRWAWTGDGNRFLGGGGGIFARNREDPAPTVGQRGDGDDWHGRYGTTRAALHPPAGV